jgi:hypothetical protein
VSKLFTDAVQEAKKMKAMSLVIAEWVGE